MYFHNSGVGLSTQGSDSDSLIVGILTFLINGTHFSKSKQFIVCHSCLCVFQDYDVNFEAMRIIGSGSPEPSCRVSSNLEIKAWLGLLCISSPSAEGELIGVSSRNNLNKTVS